MARGIVRQMGINPYTPVHDLQILLIDKLHRFEHEKDVCLLLQHEPVFTLGRHAKAHHLLMSPGQLKERGIELVHIERGGEVTYHGPGQIVCYPLLNLRRLKLRVVEYVDKLEQIMLDVVDHFGIAARRDERNHGIWYGNQKLGSVGIAVRHGISYHGMALNVSPDLTPFSWINPCGLSEVSMTSMAEILSNNDNKYNLLAEVESIMARQVNAVFATSQLEVYA